MLEKDLGDWRSLRGMAAGIDLLAAHKEEKQKELRSESLRETAGGA